LQEVLIVDGVKAGESVVKDNSLLLAREFRNAQDEAKQHTPDPKAAAPSKNAASQ
jgi:membrane fusion protein, heavy metal efflux system